MISYLDMLTGLKKDMVKVFDVLGVKVAVTTLERASQTIFDWVEQRQKMYVCVAPVATVVDCQHDPQYLKIINAAGMTTPDGMPLVWLGKMKGHKEIQRTYGPDLMLKVCQESAAKRYRHYFYGGSAEANENLVQKLKSKFPDLKIAGRFSPPYKKVGEIEPEAVIKTINESKADILWVGLGSPKQDFWMANHRRLLEVPVMIGAGAAFDFISGLKPQAPVWMQRSGLEWLFRLSCEPHRLWKRYLIGNPLFVFYLFQDVFKNILRKNPHE